MSIFTLETAPIMFHPTYSVTHYYSTGEVYLLSNPRVKKIRPALVTNSIPFYLFIYLLSRILGFSKTAHWLRKRDKIINNECQSDALHMAERNETEEKKLFNLIRTLMDINWNSTSINYGKESDSNEGIGNEVN